MSNRNEGHWLEDRRDDSFLIRCGWVPARIMQIAGRKKIFFCSSLYTSSISFRYPYIFLLYTPRICIIITILVCSSQRPRAICKVLGKNVGGFFFPPVCGILELTHVVLFSFLFFLSFFSVSSPRHRPWDISIEHSTGEKKGWGVCQQINTHPIHPCWERRTLDWYDHFVVRDDEPTNAAVWLGAELPLSAQTYVYFFFLPFFIAQCDDCHYSC